MSDETAAVAPAEGDATAAHFRYQLPEAVRVTADLRRAVPLDDPAGMFLVEAGTVIDIDQAERWGLTTAAAEFARANAPRPTCPSCGQILPSEEAS